MDCAAPHFSFLGTFAIVVAMMDMRCCDPSGRVFCNYSPAPLSVRTYKKNSGGFTVVTFSVIKAKREVRGVSGVKTNQSGQAKLRKRGMTMAGESSDIV